MNARYRDVRDLTEVERRKLLDAIHRMIELDDEMGLFDVDPAELQRIYDDQREAARRRAASVLANPQETPNA